MTVGEPRFNLRAVVRQTGIKPDTLRAWERRYGLPTPKRSGGGHRLYSQRDIATIEWLRARQAEGLSISRAVKLWEQVTSQGSDPLEGARPVATLASAIPVQTITGHTVTQLREEWMAACLEYDEARTEHILNQAFALYRPEMVAIELLQRVVAQVGEGWYQGKVTVQQEHFCTGLVIRRLEALLMGAPPPSRPGRILLACPPEEHHDIAPLVLAFLLRRRGWEVVYLGANVPNEQLETTVAAVQPKLVIMAAQVLHTAATLKETAQLLRSTGVPLAYGGLVFNLIPELRQRIAGHFLGEQLEAAPQAVESLITAPRPVPTVTEVPGVYALALEHYRDSQNLIEGRLIRSLHSGSYAHNHLALANRQMGLNIKAALALGNMDYLGTDIEWVTGLLGNYRLAVEALRDYLRAYHQAAMEELDSRGQLITGWLGSLLSGYSPDGRQDGGV